MELLAELWRRAVASSPVPGARVSALLSVAALALILAAWPLVRMLVTVCHEAGHALVAVPVGRRLSGVTLRSDTSGLTISKGKRSGPGMVATLLAGYLGPAVVGLGAAALAGTGHGAGLLWLLTVAAVALLVWVRNLYGVLVVVGAGAAVGLASWYAPPLALTTVAAGLAWLFLLAAPRPVLELFRSRSATSDAAQLAGLTHVHRYVWCLLWLVLTVAALAAGALCLVPDLYVWITTRR